MAAPDAAATDHNDPDKINAIFPDIEPSAADMYGLMAWPQDSETLAVILTWADAAYDRDLVYQIHFDAEVATQGDGDTDLLDLDVFGLISKLANLLVERERSISFRFGRLAQPDPTQPEYAVELTFEGFGLDSNVVYFPVDTEVAIPIREDSGESVRAFVGRRDDPFFLDLIGFFDSIHFGHPPMPPDEWGVENKTRVKGLFAHDADGNLITNDEGRPQLIYDSDNDEQAGLDVHAIMLELPRHIVAREDHPIVNIWGQTRRIEE